MSLKYSCFISYPHSSLSVVHEFVDDVKKALDNEFKWYLREPVYQDKYYLEPDTPDEELVNKLGQTICERASWIIVNYLRISNN